MPIWCDWLTPGRGTGAGTGGDHCAAETKLLHSHILFDAAQDLAPLLTRLQQDLKAAQQPDEEQQQPSEQGLAGSGSSSQALLRRRQLRGCSLRELLDWVYGCIVAELGK